ncbi:MAG: HAD-IIIC family phosphatase [Planctomycetota bacterium]
MSLRDEWRQLRLSPERNGFIERCRANADRNVTVGIFSATTWRPLVPLLEGELLIEGVAASVSTTEYEAIGGELATGSARYEVGVLALDDPSGYGVLYDPSVGFDASAEAELLESVLARVDLLSARCGWTSVALPPTPSALPTGIDRTPEGVPLAVRVQSFGAKLALAIAERPGVEPFDLEQALIDLGRSAAYDERLWNLGRIRYSNEGFAALARAIAPTVLASQGAGIKAVIVDLDHTLWGGVVGEDGADGVQLGDGYPGQCFRELQRELAAWRRAGILLATASKNNADDAFEVIENHSEMVLRKGDFDHHEIHWEPKPISVGRILERFNIGEDAVLFIDDNPREREAVAQAFPRLRIFDFPEEPMELASRLRQVPWPLFAAKSEEDRRRAELQAQQADRAKAREGAGQPSEYLTSLGIEVEIGIDRAEDVQRVAQLHQKTNQFNTTAERSSEAELARAIESTGSHVLTVRYRDRFGDAGIVGAAWVELEEGGATCRTFLLSCRVIGLGVERTLLRAAHGCSAPLRVPYRVTEKNTPARSFFREWSDGPLETDGSVVIETAPTVPTWIQTTEAKETQHAQ